MCQIEFHIFEIKVVGLPTKKSELYVEYFGYEAIETEFHSVADKLFTIFRMWPIARFPYLHQDAQFVLLQLCISHMCLTYIQGWLSWTRYSVNSLKFLLYHHVLAFISCGFSYMYLRA